MYIENRKCLGGSAGSLDIQRGECICVHVHMHLHIHKDMCVFDKPSEPNCLSHSTKRSDAGDGDTEEQQCRPAVFPQFLS